MILLNYENVVDPLLKEIRTFAPDFCEMKAGAPALDVCCGTGAQVIEYRKRGMDAIGVDMDPNMVRFGIRNKRKQKLANVSFCLADATALPFAEGSFDYVSVSLGLHDKMRLTRYKVVSEMIRVAKPEGTLIFIDYPVPPVSKMPSFLAATVESLAGGDHYKGFKDYRASGGLEDMLKKFDLLEEKRAYLSGGLLVIVKAKLPNIGKVASYENTFDKASAAS